MSKTPHVPIDDALKLFLTLSYPQGIPEGVDQEELMTLLRDKIAQDRPDWAEASGYQAPEVEAQDASNTTRPDYSKIKAAIISQSQQSEVPEDPTERHFYELKKEVDANIAARKAEEKEDEIKERLRRQLTRDKKTGAIDEVKLEQALSIRHVLEQQFRQHLERPEIAEKLQPESPVMEKNVPKRPVLQTQSQSSRRKEFQNGYRQEKSAPENLGRLDTATSKKEIPEELTLEDKVESIREFNERRKSNMKSRDEIMHSRLPDKLFSEEERSRSVASKSEGLELNLKTANSRTADKGLTLE